MVWLVMLRRVVAVSVLLGVSVVVCAVLVFGLSVDRLLRHCQSNFVKDIFVDGVFW